jgi:tetratricopeptide (TPR) repeat protein
LNGLKRLSLILFLANFCFAASLNGQDFDSLLLEAPKLLDDTARVNLFYKQGFLHRASDAQFSYLCAKQAEKYAIQAKAPYYIAKAKNLLGILYYRKGDLRKALIFHKDALALRTQINDEKGIGLSEANLGNVYSDLMQTVLAEQAYVKALQIQTKLKDEKQINNCLINLGGLQIVNGNYEVAENYFNEAMRTALSQNDYEVQATCLNNLAVIHIVQKNYQSAIANCQNSLKLKLLMDNEMEMADSYMNMALAYLRLNEPKIALNNIHNADSLINKYNYMSAKAELMSTKIEYYESIKNFETALKLFKQQKVLNDSLDDANRELIYENDFSENVLTSKQKNYSQQMAHASGFPFFMLGVLLAIVIGVSYTIFKNIR